VLPIAAPIRSTASAAPVPPRCNRTAATPSRRIRLEPAESVERHEATLADPVTSLHARKDGEPGDTEPCGLARADDDHVVVDVDAQLAGGGASREPSPGRFAGSLPARTSGSSEPRNRSIPVTSSDVAPTLASDVP
jgi:hypothetical protein